MQRHIKDPVLLDKAHLPDSFYSPPLPAHRSSVLLISNWWYPPALVPGPRRGSPRPVCLDSGGGGTFTGSSSIDGTKPPSSSYSLSSSRHLVGHRVRHPTTSFACPMDRHLTPPPVTAATHQPGTVRLRAAEAYLLGMTVSGLFPHLFILYGPHPPRAQLHHLHSVEPNL